jgi:sulfur carrier protein
MTGSLLSVNGALEPLEARNVAELLAARGIDTAARGIAVARNGAVVPRTLWGETALAAGDRIEIIKAMSGG